MNIFHLQFLMLVLAIFYCGTEAVERPYFILLAFLCAIGAYLTAVVADKEWMGQ